MAVKVLIKRKIKNGKLKEASRLLIKARYAAMGQQGYISSETLTDCDNPNNVVVISMWQKLTDWNQWKDTDLRSDTEAGFEALIEGSTTYEHYNLGLML
jgi:heme-degrading monooxygenase HmoA